MKKRLITLFCALGLMEFFAKSRHGQKLFELFFDLNGLAEVGVWHDWDKDGAYKRGRLCHS